VEDTGVGIPQNQIEEIFEPFRRLKNNSVITDGTGLGLTITRELVRLMGGSLKVQSTVNKGSLFSFELDFPESVRVSELEKDVKTFMFEPDLKETDQALIQLPSADELKSLTRWLRAGILWV
jgi:hypothetical protein